MNVLLRPNTQATTTVPSFPSPIHTFIYDLSSDYARCDGILYVVVPSDAAMTIRNTLHTDGGTKNNLQSVDIPPLEQLVKVEPFHLGAVLLAD